MKQQHPNCEAARAAPAKGVAHLQRATAEYLAYYHHERNHQGLAGRLIDPGAEIGTSSGKICRRLRLGGMINYFYRDAA